MSLSQITKPGDLLGKYRIIDRIGKGGMAEVYRGRHEKLDRTVAVKILHSSLANDSDFIARFEREARLAANLRHTNIVQVYDFDTQKDRLYMVMEYINGGTLKELLDKQKETGKYLSFRVISRILSQIASALDYAHSQGMLHRDLKPSNILLDKSGNAFLSDFGIARIIGQSGITRSGAIMGTPAYMSPEQGSDESLTASSDIYSLGVILFEMLTGQVPFEAESPIVVLHKQVHEPAPSVLSFRKDLPHQIEPVLEKALSKDPVGRFDTAAELINTFSAVCSKNRIDNPTQEKAHTAKPTVRTWGKRITKPGESAKSHKWLPYAIVFLFFLVLAGIMIWSTRQSTLTGIRRCTTVESCQSVAVELLNDERPVLASEAYAKAASLVTEPQQIEWAQLKCDQADLLARLGKINEAKAAYRECSLWTQNAPTLDALRLYAQQKLKSLR